MRKLALIVCCLFFSHIYTFAQTVVEIKLKNNLSFVGILIEENEQIIRLQLSGNNRRVFYKSDIQSTKTSSIRADLANNMQDIDNMSLAAVERYIRNATFDGQSSGYTDIASAKRAEADARQSEQEALRIKAEEETKAREAEKEAWRIKKEEEAKARQAEKEAIAKAKRESEMKSITNKINKCVENNINDLSHISVEQPTSSFTELGDNYLYGRGGKEFNIVKAFLCYNLGVKQNESVAHFRIGQFYETGRSFGKFYINQNMGLALLFYQKAEYLQVAEATECIKRVEDKMHY